MATSLEHRDLPYGPHAAQQLDLYLPPLAVPRPVPVVVFLHGGGWARGDKWPCPARPLTDDGFAVASVNYRLSPTAPFPAQIHDAKGAVRWLRGHADDHGLDARRVGAWGVSAGGHLAALLGTSPGVAELNGTVGDHPGQATDVQAVCDLFGPTDLSRFAADAQTAGLATDPRWAAVVTALLDGPVERRMDVVALADPVRTVTPAAPPFLILHGDRDAYVPIGQSRRLADALAAAGVPTTFTVVPGGGHGPGFDAPAIQAAIVAFFQRALASLH